MQYSVCDRYPSIASLPISGQLESDVHEQPTAPSTLGVKLRRASGGFTEIEELPVDGRGRGEGAGALGVTRPRRENLRLPWWRDRAAASSGLSIKTKRTTRSTRA